jgi:Ca-activated chloride channel family protein
VQASNSDIGLNAVLDKINELDKKKLETKIYGDYQDQFVPFFICALIFLVGEVFINERISRLWKRMNLFKS